MIRPRVPSRPTAPPLEPRTRRWLGAALTAARRAGAAGQATAEYALVLLGVAAVALTLAAWAARSGKLGELFDTVVDQLLQRAS